jgi:hypothetical protein
MNFFLKRVKRKKKKKKEIKRNEDEEQSADLKERKRLESSWGLVNINTPC